MLWASARTGRKQAAHAQVNAVLATQRSRFELALCYKNLRRTVGVAVQANHLTGEPKSKRSFTFFGLSIAS